MNNLNDVTKEKDLWQKRATRAKVLMLDLVEALKRANEDLIWHTGREIDVEHLIEQAEGAISWDD